MTMTMKEIKLLNLKLKNFKGIKAFELDLNGGNVRILGDNATGKTTLYDSFLWLLFNKDSQNQTKFSIKTLNPDGKEVNNLEHEVEATFLVDGHELTLRKVHYELWGRERNGIEKTFKGNTNDYFIDDVPTPEAQYKKAIKELIDEDVFRLLTSPTYFNEQLKWTDRRKTLFDITGDLSDEDIISANEKLQELTGILKGRKIEEHKLVIAAKKKKIQEELASTPTRISEIQNLMPKKIDVSSVETEIADIEKRLDDFATQINNVKNGSAINEKQNLLRQIELDLKEIQNELEAEATEEGYQIKAKIQEEQSNLAILQRKKEDAKHSIERQQYEAKEIDSKLVSLREDWTQVNERQFENTHQESTCPTCKQDLPVEQIEEAHVKALNDFNLEKSTELEEINARGKSLSTKKKGLEEGIQKFEKQLEDLASQITAKEKTNAELNEELELLRNQIKDARQDERYVSKAKEQESIAEEIKTLQENAQEAISGLESEVATLRTKRNQLNEQLAQQAQITVSENRIAELEARQKELAVEFEQTDKELFLIEEFTKVKVDMLEEVLNEKFELARFKLFHRQVDGALKDTCETTFGGVPYGTGLNNAAKINVGLDIIRTLSDHYGFKVPIFVDNAEAVTQLIDIDSQLISLVVSEPDKELRIETQSDTKEGVA